MKIWLNKDTRVEYLISSVDEWLFLVKLILYHYIAYSMTIIQYDLMKQTVKITKSIRQ